MPSVREAAFDLLRAHGMTTMFGNPGSTELPMLADFPDDFRYVLALQEAVAVGMADGFAQASGTVGHVNLHTAPGVGNAMGAIFNAQANKAPLLVTAGQQVRAQMTYQANLTNRDATRMPHPLVKWSYEPPRAEDVPAALGRGIHLASLPPQGPVFLSLPWTTGPPRPTPATRPAPSRAGSAERRAPTPRPWSRWPPASTPPPARSWWPGATWTPAAPGTPPWRWPRRQACRYGPRPPRAAGGSASPRATRTSAACCRPRSGRPGRRSRATTWCWWRAARCSRTTRTSPGPPLPEGTELVAITRDPDEAARAPVGDAIVADPRLTLQALAAAVGARPAPEAQPAPGPPEESDPIGGGQVHTVLADVLPDDAHRGGGVAVQHRRRCARGCASRGPGSYYFSAGGGLGFGLAAGIGVQLAQPDRPVVCVLGEGSAQYAVTGFWTAAAYGVPVTFLVLNNSEYSILKWFAGMEQVEGAPGLDLAALDTAAVAAAYGVPSRRVEGTEQLRDALTGGLASDAPELVEVGVAPGMALF